ncbi:MAG: flagellar hook protein FlgE [Bdellovibrionales bacterium]|nr:flagellar hook protein FlgE [Bdellovibrionales bacterium]
MSILASMHTGISGLQAQGTALGIIGDNIANSATTGFKASRGEFQDVIASNLRGILGGNQIGRGVRMGSVTSIFQQGNLTPTERDSDMAVRGDGFFVVKDPGSSGDVTYTRDGSFRFDDKGRLTTSDGHQVQGYAINAETGKAAAELSSVEFSSNTVPAKGSTSVRCDANLDSRKPINTASYDLATADKTSDFSTSMRIYDTTGTSQNVTMHFYKTAESEWQWHASADGAVLQGGTEGVPQNIASGKLVFTPDGKLKSDELTESNISFRGAQANQKVDFNFGDAIDTRKGTGLQGSTHYGSKSQVFRQLQDGYASGTLTNFSVDETGRVSGSYSNGITRPLAQIALARFENNEGLYKVGLNRFKEALMSGQPLLGAAGEAGRGAIVSKTLENSNVDLATEFVHMIQTQRNFQANAKTITTSDELLQEIIQLKR